VDLVARQEGTFFRLFAVKRLRPDLVSEAEVRAMFLDEARIAGLVRHPNVVSVVDVGENDAGPFLRSAHSEHLSRAEPRESRAHDKYPSSSSRTNSGSAAPVKPASTAAYSVLMLSRTTACNVVVSGR